MTIRIYVQRWESEGKEFGLPSAMEAAAILESKGAIVEVVINKPHFQFSTETESEQRLLNAIWPKAFIATEAPQLLNF